MDLAKETYRLVENLPGKELYGLSDQMRRAAVSVPSNIAEGQARGSDKEFIHFLCIARGSIAELQTQFELCVRFRYLTSDEIKHAIDLTVQTNKMVNSLIKSIKSSGQF